MPEITSDIVILSMRPSHWEDIRRIYQAGIDTGHATFASSPPSDWKAWEARHLNEHSLVAIGDERVLGWVAISPVSDRCVYAGVAEESIYIDTLYRGRGIGRRLLMALIASTEARDIWTLQTGIFPENTASIALHKRVGFEVIGTRRHLGKMSYGPLKDQWRDVLLLERRSRLAGIG